MKDPTKPRIPAFVCATGTWLFAVCIVLPYPIYITYLDMGVSSINTSNNILIAHCYMDMFNAFDIKCIYDVFSSKWNINHSYLSSIRIKKYFIYNHKLFGNININN